MSTDLLTSTSSLYSASFFVDEKGKLWVSGKNDAYQLGLNDQKNRSCLTELHLETTSKIIQVASGHTFTIVLFEDGSMQTFGTRGDIVYKVPTSIIIFNNKTKIIKVAAGCSHVLLLTDDKKVYGFGSSYNYELNTDAYVAIFNWIEIIIDNKDGNVIDIACGYNFSMILLDNGDLYSCGTNSLGQLGQKSDLDKNKLGKIFFEKNVIVKKIACGRDHAMLLDINGNIWSWGCNNDGQLGSGNTNSRNYPVVINMGKIIFTKISCGWAHSGAINDQSELFMWGLNSSNQLGISSDSTFKNIPTLVPMPDIKINHLTIGNNYTMVVASHNMTYVWGYNGHGQLALNNCTNPDKPIKNEHIPVQKIIIKKDQRVTSMLREEFKKRILTKKFNNISQCDKQILKVRVPEVPLQHISELEKNMKTLTRQIIIQYIYGLSKEYFEPKVFSKINDVADAYCGAKMLKLNCLCEILTKTFSEILFTITDPDIIDIFNYCLLTDNMGIFIGLVHNEIKKRKIIFNYPTYFIVNGSYMNIIMYDFICPSLPAIDTFDKDISDLEKDIVVVIGNQSIHTNKLILSIIPFFKRILYGDNNNQNIKIDSDNFPINITLDETIYKKMVIENILCLIKDNVIVDDNEKTFKQMLFTLNFYKLD